MIFHDNRLLADDSHEISCVFFFQNLPAAAVVIGALRVKIDNGKCSQIFNTFHVVFLRFKEDSLADKVGGT